MNTDTKQRIKGLLEGIKDEKENIELEVEPIFRRRLSNINKMVEEIYYYLNEESQKDGETKK